MARRGEKIGNAVTHQAAADHANFLLGHLRLNANERNYKEPGTLVIQFDPPEGARYAYSIVDRVLV
jgi:hypothetical protein